MAHIFSSFNQLFSSLEKQQTPALVWYSVPGERVELSGRVLMNWVAKTSNFLDDELEFSDNPYATLAMGPHWRSCALALAVLNTSGRLSFSAEETTDYEPQVFFSDDSRLLEACAEDGVYEYTVAVDHGALSPRYMGILPAGVTDYCAQVRSFGDAYFPLAAASPEAEASKGISHREAVERVQVQAETIAQRTGAGVILPLQKEWSWNLLEAALAVLLSGKSLILLDPSLSWQAERLERIEADERAKPL